MVTVLSFPAAERLHIFLGALLLGAVIHTLLQIINGDLGGIFIPHREEMLLCGTIAVQRVLGLFVGRLPEIVQLEERNFFLLLWFLLKVEDNGRPPVWS